MSRSRAVFLPRLLALAALLLAVAAGPASAQLKGCEFHFEDGSTLSSTRARPFSSASVIPILVEGAEVDVWLSEVRELRFDRIANRDTRQEFLRGELFVALKNGRSGYFTLVTGVRRQLDSGFNIFFKDSFSGTLTNRYGFVTRKGDNRIERIVCDP